MPGRPLEIVTACRAADFPILRLAHAALQRFVPFKKLHVMTARANFSKLQDILGNDVELHDEDAIIPGMTLAQLRELSLPGFPKGAGWYFQQLLKYAFCFQEEADDYYLIWDADTVPLRPLEFFDADGRMLLTKAEEEHAPYFENYRRLLGEEPNREFSFISQHMLVQKSILREMLARIESDLRGHRLVGLEDHAPSSGHEYQSLQRIRNARLLHEKSLPGAGGLSGAALAARWIAGNWRRSHQRRLGATGSDLRFRGLRSVRNAGCAESRAPCARWRKGR